MGNFFLIYYQTLFIKLSLEIIQGISSFGCIAKKHLRAFA